MSGISARCLEIFSSLIAQRALWFPRLVVCLCTCSVGNIDCAEDVSFKPSVFNDLDEVSGITDVCG